jgi:hypothetical protein
MQAKQPNNTLAHLFDQNYLAELQERQQLLKKAEVGTLFDKYKSYNEQNTTKVSHKKMLEQILLGLPLWLITLPKPDNCNQLDYIKCMTELDEELQCICARIQRSFNLQ